MLNKRNRFLTTCVVLPVTIFLFITNGQCINTKEKKTLDIEKEFKSRLHFKANPFNLSQVRLLDGPFRDAMDLDHKYLLDLESDRLLHLYRLNASLPTSAQPLGGWASLECPMRSEFIGHYLTACAKMYASTADEKLKAKAEAIVAELAKCQKAIGKGYLEPPIDQHCNQIPYGDQIKEGKAVLNPWYKVHKMLTGLYDMYIYCGNKQSLEIINGMKAWIKNCTDGLDEEKMQLMLSYGQHCGMTESLTDIYAVTGDREFLSLARRFELNKIIDPLANHRDKLTGLHANDTIPQITGIARMYEITGERRYYDAAKFFWRQVVNARSYCTGGTSREEIWPSEPYHLANELSPVTIESCCVYNMMKLTRYLFSWNAEPCYADYYERALFNSILAGQNPEDGMMMYFHPMESGWYKKFSTPRNSFWCCHNTGIESYAKLGNSIYFYDDTGVFVNLFIASELTWQDKGIRIRQETKFPEEQGTTIFIKTSEPIELALHIRIPYWATSGGKIRINGKPLKVFSSPSSYLTLRRIWRNGDRVEVELPMCLHLDRMPDNTNKAAIMYGPLVLAGKLEPMDPKTVPGYDPIQGQPWPPGWYGPNEQWYYPDKPTPAPVLVAQGNNLNEWIRQSKNEPLAFQTEKAGKPNDITLIPYYKIFGWRYAIYWDIYSKNEWKVFEEKLKAEQLQEKAKQESIQARMVDRVKIGDSTLESEHNYHSKNIRRGTFLGRSWIEANSWLKEKEPTWIKDGKEEEASWFSYDLKVLPEESMSLLCTYWGGDAQRRVFDILIDGSVIATQSLERNKLNEFFDVEYPIVAELTRGKSKITVKFVPKYMYLAGSVFGCGTLIRQY